METVCFSKSSSAVSGASEATRSRKEEVKRVYSSSLRAETWRNKERIVTRENEDGERMQPGVRHTRHGNLDA
jgi:hypothetical protein